MAVRRRDLLRTGAVLGAAALTGCTTRTGGAPVAATSVPPDEALPNSVTLGVFEYRPYAFEGDSGELTGEVIEVVRAVCGRLGLTMRAEIVPYEAMLPRVADGGLDLVGGLSIRERNCATLDFSIPDHVSLTAIVVPAGNPKKISTFTEVKASGARLALVADALEVTVAEAAGVEGPLVYPSAEEMLQAVLDGDADCAAYDDITLRDLLTRVRGLELRPPFEPPGGAPRYGFGFRKGDDSGLRAAFDGVLTQLHRNGEWLRIAKPFGFTQSNIPRTQSGSGQACAR